ncbi:MAG: ribonucleoside-diphosphate reductase, adenosylcobalamin-dependent, partial [Candidatus Tagabacteria bacterium CG_4_8_14_3_um_filter_41_8]
GLFDDVLIRDVVSSHGSVQNVHYIPNNFKKIFVTSHDISLEDHIKTLAIFQKWVDSSVSKTNNFPASATAEDVKKSYILAYELGCKGITVFRDTSIVDQVLVVAESGEKIAGKSKEETGLVRIKDEKAEGMAIYRDPSVLGKISENGSNGISSDAQNGNGKLKKCPKCSADLAFREGCTSCPVCGWGLCV